VLAYKRFSRTQRFEMIAQGFYIFKREKIHNHVSEKYWFSERGKRVDFIH
jgi:hypothetical protein